MHVPNPMGSYPLVLRSKDAPSPRNGELMFDYITNDLYFVNNGKVENAAKTIYDKIIRSKLENVKIQICKDDKTGSEANTPAVADRSMNNWYMNIQNRVIED